MERYGKIDALFNNAGMMVLGETIMDIDAGRWEQLMRINVNGPYLCSPGRAAGNDGTTSGAASSNIGSRMATDPAQGGGVLYSASKAAVHMFSYCLADEVRDLQHRGEYPESRRAAQRRLGGNPVDATGLARAGGAQCDWPHGGVPGATGRQHFLPGNWRRALTSGRLGGRGSGRADILKN